MQTVVDITEEGDTKERLTSDLNVCGECRRTRLVSVPSMFTNTFILLCRKLAYDTTLLTVAILKASDAIPLLSSDDVRRDPSYKELNDITSYFPSSSLKQNGTSAKGNGVRQSKRIRENKVKERWRKVRVRKATTIRELKVMVSDVVFFGNAIWLTSA